MIKINSAPVKAPQRFKVTIKDKKAEDTNAAGAAVIDRVATKRTLEMEWGALTNAEISAILSAVTAVFFSVTYPDPQTGADKTSTCYVQDRVAPMARYVAGAILWEGLTLELVER